LTDKRGDKPRSRKPKQKGRSISGLLHSRTLVDYRVLGVRKIANNSS
jgi:hypothetical protein